MKTMNILAGKKRDIWIDCKITDIKTGIECDPNAYPSGPPDAHRIGTGSGTLKFMARFDADEVSSSKIIEIVRDGYRYEVQGRPHTTFTRAKFRRVRLPLDVVTRSLKAYCDRNGYEIVRGPYEVNDKDPRFLGTWSHRAYVDHVGAKRDPQTWGKFGGYEVACLSGLVRGKRGSWMRLN